MVWDQLAIERLIKRIEKLEQDLAKANSRIEALEGGEDWDESAFWDDIGTMQDGGWNNN